MARKQIFGYTESSIVEGGQYVKYCMFFEDGDDFIVEVRNEAGVINSIAVPRTAMKEDLERRNAL